MSSVRRLALLLALGLPACSAALAQDSSSSTSPAPAAQAQESATPGQVSFQARIRARREQRRAAAIHEAYGHLYEAYLGMGYLRFTPGPSLQRVTYYAWNTGLTRYFNERLGVTADARGYYGTSYVGLNLSSITRPSISTYTVQAGPTYRIYLQPRYNVSARVLGGWALGNFSSDTNGFGAKTLGLYPDGNTFAISAGLPIEYNLSSNIGLRLGPEFVATGFGSTMQSSIGFNGGFVYRFGKQK